ncbi:hypothetical protein BZG02_10595 [Labilibaculum filiforme]|uniref:Lipoprotein n=1 Tax=Labilibaculum filiforme TaxID=1940526 RepID=A0A2N3HYQ4_9BACT|nr:hypothetical protein [Labilibaculum filiforme]PKQ63195.1 hypothetical protein BZG02_10595 [Labilibaculum filiforme]
MKTLNIIVIKKNLFQLFLLVFLFGCASTAQVLKNDVDLQKKTYQQIAEEEFGEKGEYILNSNGNYVLCTKELSKPLINPNQLAEFFVYDLQKEEIIYSDKIANAKISWHNNTQLLIVNQKGYISESADTGKWTYIFDLKSKKKITVKKVQ